MKNIRIFLILVIVTALVSCNKNRIYEKNKTLSDRIWHKDSTIQFLFKIENIHTGYNLYFNIRTSILYPYQNFYLKYSLEDTLGNIIKSDLSDIYLFDSKTGKPLGDGMGDIFDHQFLELEDFHFDNPGYYVVKFQQYMRREQLAEIMSIGLKVEIKESDTD